MFRKGTPVFLTIFLFNVAALIKASDPHKDSEQCDPSYCHYNGTCIKVNHGGTLGDEFETYRCVCFADFVSSRCESMVEKLIF